MKQITTGIVAIASLLSVNLCQAQTIDEIVTKNVTAMGGAEKLNSINTVKMEGNLNAMGQDVAITITKSHMIGQRVDISAMGMTGYQINTPTGGWNYMPFSGQTAPEAITDDEVKAKASQLDLHGTFNNYKDKGTTLELEGKETTEGEECFKIKATGKSGNVTTYFVSTKTFYIIKTTGKRKIQGEEMELSTVYSNYKTTPDGFVFAFTTSTPNGDINFDKIEVNKPVDEKTYTIN